MKWQSPSLLAVLVVVVSSAVIWVRTSTVKATYEFVKNEKEYRRLLQEIQGERVKRLKLTSPKRLESLAASLGLGPPKVSQILKYEPETNVSSQRL